MPLTLYLLIFYIFASNLKPQSAEGDVPLTLYLLTFLPSDLLLCFELSALTFELFCLKPPTSYLQPPTALTSNLNPPKAMCLKPQTSIRQRRCASNLQPPTSIRQRRCASNLQPLTSNRQRRLPPIFYPLSFQPLKGWLPDKHALRAGRINKIFPRSVKYCKDT